MKNLFSFQMLKRAHIHSLDNYWLSSYCFPIRHFLLLISPKITNEHCENLLTLERGAGLANVDRGGGRRWVILGSRLLQTDRAARLSRGRGTAPLQALALRHRIGVYASAYLVC